MARLFGDRPENILIVDDKVMITDMLRVTLEGEGNVEVAENGEEALRKISERYFKIIISDVDMPVMGGIELFEMAVKDYPTIKGRFLFYTGHSDPGRISFFEKNNLRYLAKPSHVKTIKRVVMEMLES